MQNEPNFSVGVFYNTNRILSGSIERSKADLEKFKRSIRRCKIEFLQIGCQGTASPGVADPMEIGLASPWARRSLSIIPMFRNMPLSGSLAACLMI